MRDEKNITGEIVSGLKQGAFFTQLDWVRAQCLLHLGFEPYPGTLNIKVSENSLPVAMGLLKAQGKELIPPDSAFCTGKVFPMTIEGICAAIVVPASAVRTHAGTIIEVIAASNLRKSLGVTDGDNVTLVLPPT